MRRAFPSARSAVLALALLLVAGAAGAQDMPTPPVPAPASATAAPITTQPSPLRGDPAPASPTSAPAPRPTPPLPPMPGSSPRAPRRAETPNSALSFAIPEGWMTRALKSGATLEPPGSPVEETIVVACEPFPLPSLADDSRVEDLLARLRAGQLATFDDSPRPKKERIPLAAGQGVVVTYKGTDDGGRPAALRVVVVPNEGRVGILTARLPWGRLEPRLFDLESVAASFVFTPAADEAALAKRLGGAWACDAVPGITLRFLANGTFEEKRGARLEKPLEKTPSQEKGGTFQICGREVRLRFDDGASRSFRVEREGPGTFESAGQTWKRVGE